MTVFWKEEAEFKRHDLWLRPKSLKMARPQTQRLGSLNSARISTPDVANLGRYRSPTSQSRRCDTAGKRRDAACRSLHAYGVPAPAPQMMSDDDEVGGEKESPPSMTRFVAAGKTTTGH